jgi:outer membrane protein TolC
MSRQTHTAIACLLIALTFFTGCHPTQPFFFHEDGDLSHYLDVATRIEHPDVETVTLPDAEQTKDPLTISNPEFHEMWDLKLEECIAIALQNSKVVRNLGGVTPYGFADALIGRTGQAQTVYDSAIVESAPGSSDNLVSNGPSTLNRAVTAAQTGGVESALADFDALLRVQASGGPVYSRVDRPRNSGNPLFPVRQDGDNSGFNVELVKKTATGARFTVTNHYEYERFNNGTLGTAALNSDWLTSFETRMDYPLLRGRGTQINRIPIVLARINQDISLANFEGGVRNLVMDLENTYWDLHLAYRNLQTAKTGRDSAQVTWKIAYDKAIEGVATAQEEAEARGQYFYFRSAVERALQDLYNRENNLRYLMGLAATDGRLIRPVDEPTSAKVEFDWRAICCETLARSPELRQQKWAIKQRELELISAKNQLLPQLDVGALYRWLGRGDKLIDSSGNGPAYSGDGSVAFEELTGGRYQEASFFFDFRLPVGFRRELAGVRHAQLQLARDTAHLEDMELNSTHLLTTAIRNLDSNHVLAQTHFNRWNAAQKEVDSVRALWEGGKGTVDLVLRAQERRAEAERDYYTALIGYSKAIAEVHFRKGSLLEYSNVQLAEGPWPQKAYWDALERARERDASYYLDYGWTRPAVVSRGPVAEGTASAVVTDGLPLEGVPTPAPTAELPTPSDAAPTPHQNELPEQGPVTSLPLSPALNAPLPRTAATNAASPRVGQPRPARFDWDSLELDKTPPAPAPMSGVIQTGFTAEVSDTQNREGPSGPAASGSTNQATWRGR